MFRAVAGGGLNPPGVIGARNGVKVDVPPLIRLWNGVPANHPVRVNLTRLRGDYVKAGIKQVWLQSPYMDQAQLAITGKELALLFPAVPGTIINAWGGAVVTFSEVRLAVRPRIRQVTDDLDGLMWDSIGCAAPPLGAAFAAVHGARVCERVNGRRAGCPTRARLAPPSWGRPRSPPTPCPEDREVAPRGHLLAGLATSRRPGPCSAS